MSKIISILASLMLCLFPLTPQALPAATNLPAPIKQKVVSEIARTYSIDEIQVKSLSIEECQMDIADEPRSGFRFILTYVLPGVKGLGQEFKAGFQIIYPQTYYRATGTNMTGTSWSYQRSLNPQTISLITEVYPDNISPETIESLLSHHYIFQVNIFFGQQCKQIDIQNTLSL